MKLENLNPPIAEIKLSLKFPYSETRVSSEESNKYSHDPMPAPVPDSKMRPRILLPGANRLVSDVAMEIGSVLRDHGFYSKGGQLFVVAADGQSIEPVRRGRLRGLIEKFVVPIRIGEVAGREIVDSITLTEAEEFSGSEALLDKLSNLDHFNKVRLPILNASGKLERLNPGYSSLHKVLTADPSLDYQIDRTLEDAQQFFDRMLGGFPFDAPVTNEAAQIAAMMTPFVRELLPANTNIPAFLCEGSRPGLGKSLLVQCAVLPIFGSAPASAKPRDEEEMRKILLGVAQDQIPVLYLDNVVRLRSPSLASFLTAPTIAGRLLGSSEVVALSRSTLVYISAINPDLSPDLARRVIRIHMVQQDGSEALAAVHDLDEPRIMELRGEILASLYAYVRDWADAGCPKPTRTHPSFVRWSQVVGGILEYAGYALPY